MLASNIRIYFDPSQFRRWVSALNRVEKEVYSQMILVPKYQATDFCHLLVNNIMTQTHMGGHRIDSNSRYGKWKRKYGRGVGKTHLWFLFGDLVKNVMPQRLSISFAEVTYLGGVNKNAYDQGGKSWFGKGDYGVAKKIAMYGALAEEKRPIFEPTTKEYAESGWKKRAWRGLRIVGNRWR